MRDLFPVFRGTEEGLSVLAPAVSQRVSVQNNQYAIVVHFGASALGPHRGKNPKNEEEKKEKKKHLCGCRYLRTLHLGVCSGLSRWAQCVRRVLIRGRQ